MIGSVAGGCRHGDRNRAKLNGDRPRRDRQTGWRGFGDRLRQAFGRSEGTSFLVAVRNMLLGLVVVFWMAGVEAVTERREGALAFSDIPELDAELQQRLNQYLSSRAAGFAGWLGNDQGILVRTRFGETRQLHWVRRPGGHRRQLTFDTNPVLNAWPVHGATTPQALFLRDVDGNEAFQIFHVDLQRGDIRRLTPTPSRQGVVIPGHRPGLFAYYSTARNGRDWDLMRLQLPLTDDTPLGDHWSESLSIGPMADETPSSSWQYHALADLIHESDGTWLPLDWSPKDQWLLALHVESAAVSLPYLIKADGSERIPLYPEDERAAYMDGRFDPDGRAIFLLSNRGREYIGLFRLDLASGELSLALDLPHDIEAISISPQRKMMAVVVNESGFSRLRLYDTASWTLLKKVELPDGVIEGLRFSPDSRRLGFTLSDPTHTHDVFGLNLENFQLTRWTRSEIGGLDESGMVRPQLIHYPSFEEEDGTRRMIPAWYYPPLQRDGGTHTGGHQVDNSQVDISRVGQTPANEAGEDARGGGDMEPGLTRGKAAVVVKIHGGPEIQARPDFDPLIQFWLRELGVAVIVPNVRGSQGYGRTYISLDDWRRREDSVRDVAALLDWIDDQEALDGSRVGLYGASYGGYMVLSAMAHLGQRVRAGVDVNGITDFVTFLRNTSEYRRNHRRAEYGDERRRSMRKFLRRISPLQMTDEITSPLFVAQGANDPRVPAAQSESMVRALRQSQREVWYLLAHDEGHGFRKHSNRVRLHTAIAQFLRRYLSLETPPSAAAPSG